MLRSAPCFVAFVVVVFLGELFAVVLVPEVFSSSFCEKDLLCVIKKDNAGIRGTLRVILWSHMELIGSRLKFFRYLAWKVVMRKVFGGLLILDDKYIAERQESSSNKNSLKCLVKNCNISKNGSRSNHPIKS